MPGWLAWLADLAGWGMGAGCGKPRGLGSVQYMGEVQSGSAFGQKPKPKVGTGEENFPGIVLVMGARGTDLFCATVCWCVVGEA